MREAATLVQLALSSQLHLAQQTEQLTADSDLYRLGHRCRVGNGRLLTTNAFALEPAQIKCNSREASSRGVGLQDCSDDLIFALALFNYIKEQLRLL